MTTVKETKFNSDALLAEMMASTEVSDEPSVAEKRVRTTPSVKKSKPKKAKALVSDGEFEKQPLNVEIDKDVFIALTLRRSFAKTSKLGTDDSFIKIVDNALRSYLKNELSIAAGINGGA